MRLAFTALAIAAFVCAPECLAAKKWKTYPNCVLKENPANDGDSFHVKAERRSYLFRLYFVDAPESDDSLPDRVKEQAAYFGISEKESVQLGKEAAKFTQNFLAGGFTAYSKLIDARGRSAKDRDYAMIQVGDKYLCEALIENGYARIFGVNEDELPDGKSGRNHIWHLKNLESEARKNKRGGWAGPNLSRMQMLQQRALPSAPPVLTPSGPSAPAAPPVTGTPAETRKPSMEPRTITLSSSINVYSLLDPGKLMGVLKAGAEVSILGEEPRDMVRIRFKTPAGKVYEAQCFRRELGP